VSASLSIWLHRRRNVVGIDWSVNVTISRKTVWSASPSAISPGKRANGLDEYTFRFNRRTSESCGLLFYRLISQAIALEPVPGAELNARQNTENAQESIA